MAQPSDRTRRVLLSVAALLLTAAGCNQGPAQGTLAGVVTYRDRPVANMVIEVHAEGTGISTSAPIDANGRFALEAPVPVGTYSLAVTPRLFADPSVASKGSQVPARVQNVKTSGLTAEVRKGANDVVIVIPE